jgi:tRNA(Ile)-lysidine synthase
MIKQVKDTIDQHRLVDPSQHQHIVLGLSGGPDSLCLFHVLLQLREELNIDIHPVHVNHGFRPGAAEADQCFVEGLCRRNGLECRTFVVDCNARAREEGTSGEEAGRNARYEAFYQVAGEIMEREDIPGDRIRIAVAQNQNDQAETLLMRILRGTGPDGLAGIDYIRKGKKGIQIIRPLLDISREAIESYCLEHRLEPREDHTNKETIYTRNKIRLELIPWLEDQFNPEIREGLIRLAAIAREDKDFLDGLVREAARAPFTTANCSDLHPAIRKRLILNKMAEKGLEQGVTAAHLAAADQLILKDKTGSSLDFPGGYRLKIQYGNILIEREEKDLETGIYYPVEINWEGQRAQLRTRRPGDCIRLPGMKGNKKLQDFFVDQKIPREQRDRIPLLAIGNRVLLIIGDELSNRGTGLDRSRSEEGFDLTEGLARRLLVEFNKKA